MLFVQMANAAQREAASRAAGHPLTAVEMAVLVAVDAGPRTLGSDPGDAGEEILGLRQLEQLGLVEERTGYRAEDLDARHVLTDAGQRVLDHASGEVERRLGTSDLARQLSA